MSREKWHRHSNRIGDKPWFWRQVLRVVAKEQEYERRYARVLAQPA